MKYLFIHQNFPGQFKFLAPTLAELGHEVHAFTLRSDAPPTAQGVRLHRYHPRRSSTPTIHPWVSDFETKVIRGEAALRKAQELRRSGFTPDAIIAHPGWGESLFLKDVWPAARLGVYCEFFYHATGADVGFDPEFPHAGEDEVPRLRLRNVNSLLHFESADAGISPTHWQASTFPEPFRSKITVVHDGIDTDFLVPNPDVALTVKTGATAISLQRSNEVITFVNRDLEPYRGYHVFMRALPELLRLRPQARVLMVGGNEVSYGARAPEGQSWKEIFAREVRPKISDSDWARVHFLGKIPYPTFRSLLQLSTVHVYLTYPFVLSWSLIEAMSVGCAIVGSDTAPVREVIAHGINGRLVPFFDASRLAREVALLAGDEGARKELGNAARAVAQQRYDLRTVCLPSQVKWVEQLTA